MVGTTNGSSSHALLNRPIVPCALDNAPWSGSSSYALLDPHSGEKLYDVSSVIEQDCLQTIESAASAFKSWKSTGAAERRAIFNRAAGLLMDRKDEYIKLSMSETTANAFWRCASSQSLNVLKPCTKHSVIAAWTIAQLGRSSRKRQHLLHSRGERLSPSSMVRELTSSASLTA